MLAKRKAQLESQQQKLDDHFVEACKRQYLAKIKDLAHQYPFKKKGRFDAFLAMVGINRPRLNIYAQEGEGFLALCKSGSIQAMQYVSNLPQFQACAEQPNHLEYMTQGLFQAISQQHMDFIDILAPFVQKCSELPMRAHETFVWACSVGNLSTVKTLLTDSRLDAGQYCYYYEPRRSYRRHETAEVNKGFKAACEAGHLPIVQYLTSYPELSHCVDLTMIEPDDQWEISNHKIMEHFIFTLDLSRDHTLFKHISYRGDIEQLFQRRELHENLSKVLPSTIGNSAPRKKKI